MKPAYSWFFYAKRKEKNMDTKDLLVTIQNLRGELNVLIEDKELTDPDVIQISQELDEALIRYENLIRGKSHE